MRSCFSVREMPDYSNNREIGCRVWGFSWRFKSSDMLRCVSEGIGSRRFGGFSLLLPRGPEFSSTPLHVPHVLHLNLCFHILSVCFLNNGCVLRFFTVHCSLFLPPHYFSLHLNQYGRPEDEAGTFLLLNKQSTRHGEKSQKTTIILNIKIIWLFLSWFLCFYLLPYLSM